MTVDEDTCRWCILQNVTHGRPNMRCADAWSGAQSSWKLTPGLGFKSVDLVTEKLKDTHQESWLPEGCEGLHAVVHQEFARKMVYHVA